MIDISHLFTIIVD